jgi:hypothetical protein
MKQNFWTYNKPLSMQGLGGGANSLNLKSSGGGEVILPNAGNVNGNAQQQEITISNFISAGQTLKIPSGLYIWSDNTSNPALTVDIACTIINEGIIMGRGGNGGSTVSGSQAGNDGGSAIKINSGVTGVTITNNSGAYIFGGGGGGSSGFISLESCGGGGGAGGGKGGRGSEETTLTAGGAIGANGSSSPRTYGGVGGENGGSGGSSNNDNSTTDGGASGGGGGRSTSFGSVSAPTVSGGTFASRGGYGGSHNSTGGNATGGLSASFRGAGGGGGGYGANGGVGKYGNTVGSGGKAIDDSGVTYTLTNNGTIYGGT